MASSVKRLRWILAAAAVLLVLVVTAYIGYGRYLALRVYARLLHHAGATISHDTNGITWSQSRKDRPIFKVHAKTATQLSEGKYDLHGVDVLLYGRDGKATDTITGDEFIYDEKEGIVRAIGEVHMDVIAPQSLTAARRSSLQPPPGESPQSGAEPAEVIHVRTSGLVYLKKLGVATTSEQVEFHYNGMECTAVGAEFDMDESVLRLLSDVVATGVLRGKPLTIHAAKAEIDRTANVATLMQTAAASGVGRASADLTILNLRKDGSIASATATGHVLLTGTTQRVTSSQLDATFTAQTLPQTARLSGGVQLEDSSARRPAKGSATAVDMVFDPHGALSNLTATGAPRLALTDKRSAAAGLLREMHGDRIVARFVPTQIGARAGSRLDDLQATGSAEAHGESVATGVHAGAQLKAEPQLKTTTLTADDLDMVFAPDAQGKAEPHKLAAAGHTLLRQEAPAGELETSSGDQLDAVFTQAQAQGKTQLALASAVQTGHVVVHRTGPKRASSKAQTKDGTQQQGDATADRASYDGASEKLTLSGRAHLVQDTTTVTAATVVLDERTQDADAVGDVQATLEGSGSSSPARSVTFTHVLAASAHFTHETRQAEFHGSDAQPAKMWHEASQVQAATLLLDNVRRTFSARATAPGAMIHAVFAGVPAGEAVPATSATAKQAASSSAGHSRYVRVASTRLDYSDAQREAIFTGPQGVTMVADSGTIRAQRAEAYLQPAASKPAAETANVTPFNGSLDRVVITGDVQLDQPGRHGNGETLVYTASTGDSVLTGVPGRLPRILDAQQGSITGASLLFGDAGSTIIVSGESGAARPQRVHTETHLEPKSTSKSKEERQ